MTTGISARISAVLDSVLAGQSIDPETTSALGAVKGQDLWDLLTASGRVRERFRGSRLDLCSIVNAKSGACSEDCRYCAQSVHHSTNAPVYPLIPVEQMGEAARSAKKNGAKRFCIVTSGRGIDSRQDLERIARGIETVREAGLSPCATLGTLSRDQLAFLRDAGLDRYHHNIETSRSYFPRICSTHSFDERIGVLQNVRDLGLSACSGGILGMGETMEDRIEMAFTLRDLDVDSVPLNFLMPIAGTPLGNSLPMPPLESLHAIALFRLVLPNREIRVCGGRGSLGPLHPFIFLAGADGFMIGNYLTKSGLNPQDDLRMVRDLGLSI